LDLGRNGRAADGHEPRHHRPMTLGELVHECDICRLATLRKPRALDELIGDPLERRHDHDDGLASMLLESDRTDVSHAYGSGQRRAAELQYLHQLIMWQSTVDCYSAYITASLIPNAGSPFNSARRQLVAIQTTLALRLRGRSGRGSGLPERDSQ